MTTKEFAKEEQITYKTALSWLRLGIVPGATKIDTPWGSYWSIPASSVGAFRRPKSGPKTPPYNPE